MRLICWVAALCILCPDGNTQPIHPGLTGQDLIDALVADYKPGTVLTLAHAKDSIYAVIDLDGDSVRGIYTDFAVHVPQGEDPSQAVFQNGAGINLEHGWPQSKGATEGTQPYSDMHHLFPTRVAVNSARGSNPFADIPDDQTSKWFYRDIELTGIPEQNINAYSESTKAAFEPRESVKGDVARAMFYFYTMYRASADAADPGFFGEQREFLCAWHDADPVDARELGRSTAIAAYQEGRQNPFVLDCTLARRSYCPDNAPCTTGAQEAQTAPVSHVVLRGCTLLIEPANHFTGRLDIAIYNTIGQAVKLGSEGIYTGGGVLTLHLCDVPVGLYVLHLRLRNRSAADSVMVEKLVIR